MSAEFDLIQRYFLRPAQSAILGGGDDAALLQPTEGHCLAVSSDTLVVDVHFFADTDPAQLGWKALAVNLSDLAAMGAKPRWVTLALTLPKVDDDWLLNFASGLYRCADQYGIDLVGGDTTQGNLSMTLTVIGEVPICPVSSDADAHAQREGRSLALRRDGAQLGDTVWVSGELGEAALALAAMQGRMLLDFDSLEAFSRRLHMPEPRVALGLALRGVAHSAIDVSDGLLADLGHILSASGVSAVIDYSSLPLSPLAAKLADHAGFMRSVLAGGDDYELCFTAPAEAEPVLTELSKQLGIRLTAIGRIEAGSGLRVLDAQGQCMSVEQAGFDHFSHVE